MPISFTLNQAGGIRVNSLRNIGLILEHDKTLLHTFAYNDFSHEISVIKDIPELTIKKGRLNDSYYGEIQRFIEDTYQESYFLFHYYKQQLLMKHDDIFTI